MARCACGGETTCACLVVAAPNTGVEVTGRGTTSDPYVIGLFTGLPGFSVTDTDTVDLSLIGAIGENETPVLSANATVALTDLTDLQDPDPPASGDVPTWITDHWEFAQPEGSIPPDGVDGEVLTRVEAVTDVNLVPNPRFMGAPLDTLTPYIRWTPSRATIAADATKKRHPTGPQSAKLTVTDAAGAVDLFTGTAAAAGGIPITAGTVYTAGASVFPDPSAGGNWRIALYYYDAAGAALGNQAGPLTNCIEGNWTDLRYTFAAAPVGATQARVLVTSSTLRPLSTVFWVGEPFLIAGTYGGSYFDGASPDGGDNTYSWSGTADASPSNKNLLTVEWEAVPSGISTVHTANGVGGDGSVATPVVAETSGIWNTGNLAKSGNDPLAGRSIYVDSAGDLRSRPTELSAAQGSAMFTGASAPGAWPEGMQILQVTAASAATWPGAVSGTVYTIRRPGEADANAIVHQWFYKTAATMETQQILYRTATGSPTAWSAWRDLTVAGGSAVVDPIDYCILRVNSTQQSMAASTEVPMVFDAAASTDPQDMWDGSSLVTVKRAGLYEITMNFSFASTAAGGSRITLLRINNGTVKQWYETYVASQAVFATHSVSVVLNAGDTIQMRQYQSSGSALLTYSGTVQTGPAMYVTRIPQQEPGGGGVIVDRPASAMRQHLAATSILHATVTAVPFDTEVYSEGIAWDAANAAFIAPDDGYYQVAFGLSYAANATGSRIGYIQVGGVSVSAASDGGSSAAMSGSATVKALAGQQIRILTQQTSTVSLALVGGNAIYNWCSVTKVPHSYAGSAVSTYGEKNYASSRTSSTATSIPNAVATAVPMEVSLYEDGIPWNGNEFVIPVAGYYKIDATLSYAFHATGSRYIMLWVNGAQKLSMASATSSGTTTVNASDTVKLAAGDTVSVRAYHTAGAALGIGNNLNYNRLSIAKVPAPVINGAAASGIWGVGRLAPALVGTNDLAGGEVYIDSRGQIRSLVSMDTGWKDLTGIAGGWTVPSPYPTPQARLMNGEVVFRGRLVNGTFTGGYTDLCVLPAGIPLPTYTCAFPIGTNTAAYKALQIISGTGMCQVYSSAASGSHLDFANVRYPID